MLPKVLITGGTGVLSEYIVDAFSDFEVITPSHQEMDLTNVEQIQETFDTHKPNFVIHLAALTNVDFCEQHPETAQNVNARGTQRIAKACKKYGAFLTYVSTAAVFNGRKSAFSEEDLPDPINVYGQSKWEGEKYIQEILSEHFIFRPAWLIGGGKKEKKFISYIINLSKTQKEIKVVNDKLGTISYARELARVIRESIDQKRVSGIYHYGSSGPCTRFDIARVILRKLNSSVALTPVESKYFESTFLAPRPDNEVLISHKIVFPYTWKESILNYLENEVLI